MVAQKKSIITSRMKNARSNKEELSKSVDSLTQEQEDFINRADVIVNTSNKENAPAKRGRGRPINNVKKLKMTFELAENLVQELDDVVKNLGMTRSSFMAQAVMKAVKDANS
ncbi:MAG: hypothetical protein K6F69_03870 [Treponema sp.]|nr:hypothetical protein [Treponema sp.]